MICGLGLGLVLQFVYAFDSVLFVVAGIFGGDEGMTEVPNKSIFWF